MPFTVDDSLNDSSRRLRAAIAALEPAKALHPEQIMSLVIVLGHVERIRRELSRPDAERRCA